MTNDTAQPNADQIATNHPQNIQPQETRAEQSQAPDSSARDSEALRDQPPAHLPTDPRVFWNAGAGPSDFDAKLIDPAPAALESLGPPPFPKGRFPLIGFLATVYDHVSDGIAGQNDQ